MLPVQTPGQVQTLVPISQIKRHGKGQRKEIDFIHGWGHTAERGQVAERWWLMPVILATQEAAVRRIMI
jgi:hypothetical protein